MMIDVSMVGQCYVTLRLNNNLMFTLHKLSLNQVEKKH